MDFHANLFKSRFLAAVSHELRQRPRTLSLVRGILTKKIKDHEKRRGLEASRDQPTQISSG